MNINYTEDFSKLIIEVSKILNKPINNCDFEIIDRDIPHTPPTALPPNKNAVYTFYCPNETCFLKIGRVGYKSQARFTSQHYNPGSAKSNLAKSLLQDNEM